MEQTLIDNCEVENKQFIENIFQKVYGVSTEALNTDEALRSKIRTAVNKLREVHKNTATEDFIKAVYGDPDCRAAYMFVYYPYHVEPAYRVVSEHVVPRMQPKPIIKIECFAGGPCPEILGTAKALFENNLCEKLSINVYDYKNGWFDQQRITAKICNEQKIFFKEFHSCQDYDIRTATAEEKYLNVKMYADTDIFLVQNYLSHSDNDENFFRWLSMLAGKAKQNAFFVFIDFKNTWSTFQKMCDDDFLSKNGLSVVSSHVSGYALKIKFGFIPVALFKNIFTGEGNFVRKYKTEYYFVVLKKSLRVSVFKEFSCLSDDDLEGCW